MKVAFIHNDKKIGTGAHYINDLMSSRLRESGVRVKNFYPRNPLLDAPLHLKGISNVLFFHSLLEHKDEILKYDLIQGTTYTPLAFLPFPIPVVCHFGSTSWGFLRVVPYAKDLDPALRKIWVTLKQAGVITELNVRTRRPLRDVAEIEKLVALKADMVIATSEIVKQDLIEAGVKPEAVAVVPNAIEDYWFSQPITAPKAEPSLVFLGRLGTDAFTLKLKGFDRLVDIYRSFPAVPKLSIAITLRKELVAWCERAIPKHVFIPNLRKESVPETLRGMAGSVLLITSRYEGFSLSLIEGMSQGLIPVTYPVGIAPEIIENGRNGYLVSTQAEAKKAVAHLLTLPEDERLLMARAARETARKFTSKAISGRLIAVYEEVLKRASAPKEEEKKP